MLRSNNLATMPTSLKSCVWFLHGFVLAGISHGFDPGANPNSGRTNGVPLVFNSAQHAQRRRASIAAAAGGGLGSDGADTPLLWCEALEKSYDGIRVQLDGASLRVGRGEVIALVGANGCGKSTLMKILAGLESPEGGRVERKRGVTLALVDQEPEFGDPGKRPSGAAARNAPQRDTPERAAMTPREIVRAGDTPELSALRAYVCVCVCVCDARVLRGGGGVEPRVSQSFKAVGFNHLQVRERAARDRGGDGRRGCGSGG